MKPIKKRTRLSYEATHYTLVWLFFKGEPDQQTIKRVTVFEQASKPAPLRW